MTGNNNTLFVIVPHKLSDIQKKGEITPRYYNPGNLFKHVHIVLCANDNIGKNSLQETVGDADLTIHTLPIPRRYIYKSLFYNPVLLKSWTQKAVDLAQTITPDLIRCYGFDLNIFAATHIKKAFGTPIVASLHMHPYQLDALSAKQKFLFKTTRNSIRKVVPEIDIAVGVYESLRTPLQKLGAKKIEIAYNVIGSDTVRPKTSYVLKNEKAQILYVGRLLEGKNPESIIHAVARIPETELSIIGKGPLKSHLETLCKTLNVKDRIRFIDAINNADLCRSLKDYDLFVLHNDYFGIPKTLMEASLSGLPIIANTLPAEKVPEYRHSFFLPVNNTPDSYADAIKKMLSNNDLRKNYGKKSKETADLLWHPQKTEERYVDLYKQALGQNKA